MDAKHIGPLLVLGPIWATNLTLSVGLLVAPLRLTLTLCKKPAQAVNWLRLLGSIVLVNTLFGMLAAHMASVYWRGLCSLLGMPP